jgi:hypothetical protein
MPRTLDDVRRLAAADHGLATVAVPRPDLTVQVTLVNAGVMPHPVTGAEVVALVARGGTHKLDFLCRRASAAPTTTGRPTNGRWPRNAAVLVTPTRVYGNPA